MDLPSPVESTTRLMALRSPIVLLILVVLALWRVTHLLWAEDGPGDIFVRFRRLAGSSFVGRILDCFYCLSLWTAAPAAWLLGITWKGRALLWFALSGAVILVERATSRTNVAPPPPARWHETPISKEQNLED